MDDTRTGSTTSWGSSPPAARSATAVDDVGRGQHAGLDAAHVEVVEHRLDLLAHERGLEGHDAAHLGRVLRRHGGQGTGAVHAQGGEGLEVGLGAGAPARVGAGDGERRAVVSGPAPSHHRRAPGYRRPVTRNDAGPATPVPSERGLCIAGEVLASRLILGTGGMTSLDVLGASLASRAPPWRRWPSAGSRPPAGARCSLLDELGVRVLPNTAGCSTASRGGAHRQAGRGRPSAPTGSSSR